MKAKKLLALGLLSAMAVTTMSATGVSAAEPAMDGTGATDISYKPGSSTGGDIDGNVASWTVDYPVKIVLDDATVNKASARDIEFSIVNTQGNGPYTGGATVKAKLKTHTDTADSGQTIKLKDNGGKGKAQTNVKMKLENTRGVVLTNTDSELGSLNTTTKTLTLDAYLSDKSGAKNDQTYGTTLTWAFHSDAY